jgi:hypothetical protein
MFNVKMTNGKILQVLEIHESYSDNSYRLNLTLSGKKYSLEEIVSSVTTEAIFNIEIMNESNELMDTITNYTIIDHIFKSFSSEINKENGLSEQVVISVGLRK